jgi:hypothetical protein
MACTRISMSNMQQTYVSVRTNLLQHVVLVVLGHDYGSAIVQETCKEVCF